MDEQDVYSEQKAGQELVAQLEDLAKMLRRSKISRRTSYKPASALANAIFLYSRLVASYVVLATKISENDPKKENELLKALEYPDINGTKFDKYVEEKTKVVLTRALAKVMNIIYMKNTESGSPMLQPIVNRTRVFSIVDQFPANLGDLFNTMANEVELAMLFELVQAFRPDVGPADAKGAINTAQRLVTEAQYYDLSPLHAIRPLIEIVSQLRSMEGVSVQQNNATEKYNLLRSVPFARSANVKIKRAIRALSDGVRHEFLKHEESIVRNDARKIISNDLLDFALAR